MLSRCKVYGYFNDLPRRAASEKHYMKKYLILLKIQNMMDINVELLQWFIKFWVKSIRMVLLKPTINRRIKQGNY